MARCRVAAYFHNRRPKATNMSLEPHFPQSGSQERNYRNYTEKKMFMEMLKYYSFGTSWAPSWPSPLGNAPGHPWRLLGGALLLPGYYWATTGLLTGYYWATTGRLPGDYRAGPRECPL